MRARGLEFLECGPDRRDLRPLAGTPCRTDTGTDTGAHPPEHPVCEGLAPTQLMVVLEREDAVAEVAGQLEHPARSLVQGLVDPLEPGQVGVDDVGHGEMPGLCVAGLVLAKRDLGLVELHRVTVHVIALGRHVPHGTYPEGCRGHLARDLQE